MLDPKNSKVSLVYLSPNTFAFTPFFGFDGAWRSVQVLLGYILIRGFVYGLTCFQTYLVSIEFLTCECRAKTRIRLFADRLHCNQKTVVLQ